MIEGGWFGIVADGEVWLIVGGSVEILSRLIYDDLESMLALTQLALKVLSL